MGEQDLFVTIDGTANSPVSRTNAARLFEIVDAHSRPGDPTAKPKENTNRRATYYAEGVGGNGAYNVLGLGAGFGMSDDIRNAYAFLTVHYQPDDRVFLNGFSRGAYAVRALGGMIHVAGIPDLSEVSAKRRGKIVRALFKAYKTSRRKGESRRAQYERQKSRVDAVWAKSENAKIVVRNDVEIEAMSLWDTVESVGLPRKGEDPREELDHYLLTNCNVKKVFHALALDDNRSDWFTPIFADAKQMYALCDGDVGDDRVEEVWFSGSHSDVAGTYQFSDRITNHLAGVSLNWMLGKLEKYHLYPKGFRVFEDPFGVIHNAREDLVVWKAAPENYREPFDYQIKAETDILGDTKGQNDTQAALRVPKVMPKVHASAIARLSIAKWLSRQQPACLKPSTKPRLICTHELRSNSLIKELQDRECLQPENDHGWLLREDKKCITVVGEFPQDWPDIPPRKPPVR